MQEQVYEQEEEQIPRYGNVPAVNVLRDQIQSALKDMTDTSKDIENFKMFLLNQYVDENGEIQQSGEPLVNEYGFRKLVGRFQAFATPHYILMDTTDDMYFNSVKDFVSESLVKGLVENKKKFGIKDIATSNLINDTFVSHVGGIIGRGPGERGFWTKTFQDLSIHQAQPKKERGLLGGLFGGKN